MVGDLQALSSLEEDDHDRSCGAEVPRRHGEADLPRAKATARLRRVAFSSCCSPPSSPRSPSSTYRPSRSSRPPSPPGTSPLHPSTTASPPSSRISTPSSSPDDSEEGIILESLDRARDAVLECAAAVAGKGSSAAPEDGALQGVAREVAGCLGGLGRDALRGISFVSPGKKPAKEVPKAAVHVHRLQCSTAPLTGASSPISTTSLPLTASSSTCPQALPGWSLARLLLAKSCVHRRCLMQRPADAVEGFQSCLNGLATKVEKSRKQL